MWFDILLFGLGIILLAIGGDLLIRGALSIAKRLGVSALISGLVIVGFGTSTPELVVSLQAVLSDQPAIAIGNVVGSNIGNILLILAISGLIMPMAVQPAALKRDALVMVLVSILLCVLMLNGALSRLEGLIFVLLLVLYLVITYIQEKQGNAPSLQLHTHEAEEVQQVPEKLWSALGLIVLGLVGLISGAQFLVNGAVSLAQIFGVSEALIGLTIVAIGTSLPELTVSVIAALRKHADVAIGNILGSNIFNILGILGISATVQSLPVVTRIQSFDSWYMLGAAVLLFVFLLSGRRLSRLESAALLAAYIVYLYVSIALIH
ncbi:MAG: cation:H+ antiporter ChaA [Idiomarinaceae bacterium HL-53]|nr:MAG: cation:H+ antiporter ChaA [Idiomarinaceae bacterium HL-53]CUS48841.1 cation:H+ antiporter [Idiomarinaceae bacterium HL-53]